MKEVPSIKALKKLSQSIHALQIKVTHLDESVLEVQKAVKDVSVELKALIDACNQE